MSVSMIGAAAVLREPSHPLATMMRMTLCGILIARRRDGAVLDVNDAFAASIGRTRDQVIGRTTAELDLYVDPSVRARVYEALDHVGSLTRMEVLVRHPSGRVLDFLISASLLELGGEECALGFFEDVTELRAADAERRLLTGALHAAANAIVITDTGGAVRWVNEAFTRLTGYRGDEVMGMNPRVLKSGAQDEAFYRAMWATITAGDIWHGELVNRRKDGRLYDEEMTITPVRQGRTVTHFIAIKQDVTARKRVGEARIEAEERYRLALDASDLGTWRHDLETGLFDFDPRAQEHFGLRHPTASLEEVIAAIHPGDRAAVRQLIETSRAPGGPARIATEVRVVLPGGEVRWLASHVQLSSSGEGPARAGRFAIATSQDVTDRRRAADALKASEDRYRSLVDNLEALVYSVDRDGRVTFLNHAITRFGYRAEELIGRALFDFVHPDDREEMAREFSRRLTGELTEPSEHRWIDAAGKVRFMRASSRPLLVDGEPVGLTGLASDVTEHRATEEQFRAAQRMEAVGRLAGGVAHDFNNILSVITSYSELAMGELRPEDPLHADLAEIAQASQRAAGLTRQLLAFSRRQLLEPEAVDLGALITGLSCMLRRLIGEDVLLRVEVAEPLGLTRVDRGQIEQVVMNLAVNARDAMPEGGELRLAARDVRLDGEAAAALDLLAGDYVELRATDTGAGMTPEVRARIFEPFFTTKPVGQGTGLGLSMVHGIVKQSGGGIAVETAPGQGATFRVFLPRLGDANEVERAEWRPVVRRGLRGHERILVVEDEPALRAVTRRLLSAAGYHVDVAAHAGEALLLCEQREQPLDLVLTDVVMPGMSGRRLAERLHEVCPSAKVMFMSGYTDELLAQHDVLGYPFVRKPFDRATLTARVREVLDGGDR